MQSEPVAFGLESLASKRAFAEELAPHANRLEHGLALSESEEGRIAGEAGGDAERPVGPAVDGRADAGPADPRKAAVRKHPGIAGRNCAAGRERFL